MLKRLIFTSLLSISVFILRAQNESPNDIIKSDPHISVQLDQKLLMLCFCDEVNQNLSFLRELDRCTGIYKGARLKGGSKGIKSIVVLCNTNPDLSIPVLTSRFPNLVFLQESEIPTLANKKNPTNYNCLSSDDGQIIRENIGHDHIFSTINQLLSR